MLPPALFEKSTEAAEHHIRSLGMQPVACAINRLVAGSREMALDNAHVLGQYIVRGGPMEEKARPIVACTGQFRRKGEDTIQIGGQRRQIDSPGETAVL